MDLRRPASSTTSSSPETSCDFCWDRLAASKSSVRRATASRRCGWSKSSARTLVFLDVQMPGLTGFEVARRLLERRRRRRSRLRDRLRPVRDRGIRGQRGRLPVEAGRAAAARAGARARAAAASRTEQPAADAARTRTWNGSSNWSRNVRARRERLAVKVGERFLLVQADEIIYASLADDVITVVTGTRGGHVELQDA